MKCNMTLECISIQVLLTSIYIDIFLLNSVSVLVERIILLQIQIENRICINQFNRKEINNAKQLILVSIHLLYTSLL